MKTIWSAMSARRIISIFAISVSLVTAQPAGKIRAWGANTSNQLGDGLVGNSTVPESVVGLSDVIAVAGGAFQSVAVTSDGAVWAWGINSPVPVVVTGLGAGSGVIAVAAGTGHNLALKSDGSVVAWGSNSFGQLGVSGIATSSVPVAVTGLGPGSGVIAISAGFLHSLALKSDGSVVAWGANGFGVLGVPGLTQSSVPVAVTGLAAGSGVIAISAGDFHNLALKSDGAVIAWGDDSNGALGDGKGDSVTPLQSLPVGVSGLGSGSGVTEISAGGGHSMALKSDGSVLAWGINADDEVGGGNPSAFFLNLPTPVTGLGSGSGVVKISGGGAFSVALKSDGTALAWGRNFEAEVGDGTLNPRPTPVPVTDLTGGVTVAQGPTRGHTLVIVQPLAQVSATSLDFGDQLGGTTSAPKMITIQNSGPDPLVIDSLQLSGAAAGDFRVSSSPTPINVPAGGSTAIAVDFTPTAGFARLATLLIDDKGFQGPHFVALSGNGLAQADLAIALGGSLNPARNHTTLTYTITVENGGPTAVPAVVMNDTLPPGVSFVSGKTTLGTCLSPGPGTTGNVACNLGTLNSGDTATITITVAVSTPGGSSLINTASVAGAAHDPNLANNSATIVTEVFGSRH
jgi:uncharacterized repeat protein (TIGR01451 family)